tara:strand:+ start:242 stop:454 length:213 start_codon:yes stop_codon:yes gene_type:complete
MGQVVDLLQGEDSAHCCPWASGLSISLLLAKDRNTMRIQAIGKEYTVSLQGEKVMIYESASVIAEGPLGI